MESGQWNLRAYPKVELHRHLEGALRFSTLLELARDLKMDVPADIAQQKEKFLVLRPMQDLITVLDKFWNTQAVLSSEEILTRITFEAIEDAVNDGIRILELRYAPTFIRKNHENLSFEKIHNAVLEGVKKSHPLPCAVGLIATLQRTLTVQELTPVTEFILSTQSSWAGVDLADNEADFPAREFQSLFVRLQKAGLPITIHAGETPDAKSPLNVRDAVNVLGAQRIGHGLQIINNLDVLNEIRTKKIPLELCPTSNWLTQAIPNLAEHPIRRLLAAGVLVTINSDDPGIFGIDLTHEYELLHSHYGFSLADFDRCNDVAAAASFLPFEKKQKFWPRPIKQNPSLVIHKV